VCRISLPLFLVVPFPREMLFALQISQPQASAEGAHPSRPEIGAKTLDVERAVVERLDLTQAAAKLFSMLLLDFIG